MKILKSISLSRASSGLTAVVCAGFLGHAILTNNGGNADSQARWEQSRSNGNSVVSGYNKDSYAKWRADQDQLDKVITGSLPSESSNSSSNTGSGSPTSEPSVLSLIRENSDIRPSVATGAGRVSVIVKEGDTLFGIARRHGLKISELARLNGLEEPFVIRIGQTLYVAR